eukprot:CAMPEP_0173404576 /NCGR_PEP_ID=MMETSP1356-20130122/59734_1 /TAXON_ID=77927 ORGANISM="Hemiselmis virescens, Strain PCC157" /NCGR_SAMPLE_ID=MMETSP1356 /ASSEMBLY_ACC=CAM_ASM_000847 /LENGTH=335 /DNA_ID=CAMNT_0014365275 /DNA_START=21 /DNA_END=1025 /DNA_ORIENTATION=+
MAGRRDDASRDYRRFQEPPPSPRAKREASDGGGGGIGTFDDGGDTMSAEGGYARSFCKAMFNPLNPFAVGAASALSVVAAQTAWMRQTYEPLPHPQEDRSSGFIEYEHSDWSGRTRRALVLGDSLVLGVGCDKAPVLSESLVRAASNGLKSHVAWRSFGIDGGDCRGIHKFVVGGHVLPEGLEADGSDEAAHRAAESLFRGDARALRSEGTRGPMVDLCVVFCGLNDFKKLYMGRTAGTFGRDLRNFVLDLRRSLGAECSIIFPALPMEPTRFPEPLRSFVIFVGEVFDEEKTRLARDHTRIYFLSKPSQGWWRSVRNVHGDVISADGVHPNEIG